MLDREAARAAPEPARAQTPEQAAADEEAEIEAARQNAAAPLPDITVRPSAPTTPEPEVVKGEAAPESTAPVPPPAETPSAAPAPAAPTRIRTIQQIQDEDGVGPKKAAQIQAEEIAAIGRPITREEMDARKAGVAAQPPARAEPPPGENTPASGGYTMFTPDQLTLDPERFQYKAADERGVTGALTGTDKWEPALANPITVYQEDGKNYVVNGHQRTDLATRAVAAGQEGVQVPARVFRAEDGYTPEFMKALGAYQNIAEGSGTALDAAKILRAKDAVPEGMTLPTLPPKSALVQQAKGLSGLSDEAFGAVINGVVPPEHAAFVGQMITDPAEQMAALDVLNRAKPQNAAQAGFMVEDIRNSGFLNGSQTSLFGDEAFAQSLVPERAKIMDAAQGALRRAKSVFGAAVKGDETLTAAGNKLTTEGNIKAKADNERILDYLQREGTIRGPLSDRLSAAARELADGQPVAGVVSRFLKDARDIERRGPQESVAARDLDGGDGHEAEGQGGFFASARPIHNPELTGSEQRYFDDILNNPANRAELLDDVPSFAIRDGRITINPDDAHNFANWIDDTVTWARGSERLPPSFYDGSIVDRAIGQQGFFASRRVAAPGQTDIFGGTAAQAARREAEPTIRGDPRQQAMPGMEASARQAQAARDAGTGRIQSAVEQRRANEGLFAPKETPQPGLPMAPREPWGKHYPGMTDETHLVNPRGGEAEAVRFVRSAGQADGMEHLAIIDGHTGEIVHAATDGRVDGVAYVRNERRGDRGRYTIVHNHPRSTAMSSTDIQQLTNPITARVVAVGHDGHIDSATMTPQARTSMSGVTFRMKSEDAWTDVRAKLSDLVNRGLVTKDEFSQVYAAVAMRIAHDRGLIDYRTTRDIENPAIRAAFPEVERYDAQDRNRGPAAAGQSESGASGVHPPDADRAGPQPSDRAGSNQAGARGDAAAPRRGPAQGRLLEREGASEGGFAERTEEPDRLIEGILTPLAKVEPAKQSAVVRVGNAVRAAFDYAGEVKNDIKHALSPMTEGTPRAQRAAHDFANALRGVQFRYGEIDREITKTFTPSERAQMGRALDAQSVFEQKMRGLPPDEVAAHRAEFNATGGGIEGLNPAQRRVVDMLDQLSQHAWREMQKRGMVDPKAQGLPFYFPRQLVMWSEGEGFKRVPSEGGKGKGIDERGGNLTTAGPMRREHLTPEETQRAAKAKLGADAQLLTDIRSLPQRLAFTHRAIAGVDMMNEIKRIGREVGVDTVVQGDIPGLLNPGDYFTMSDHPSFRRWAGSGWQAVHVAKEFEGPLRAVLTQPSPTWFRAAMQVKGGVMSAIMYSPFIHLGVEIGRALPLMPGRIVTLRALRDGSTLRRDFGYMDGAIKDGLAPLGREGWHTDPVSIADAANVEGRSGFLRALGNVRDAVANAAGKVGGQFAHDVVQHPHQTLLWDQVFNLQVGIYDYLKNKWIAEGHDPTTAGTMAAHMANRYAGALPPEHLSRGANMAANLLLFSRSFTLGNLGIVKDMFRGAPSHVLSAIEDRAGPAAATSAKSTLRRKAIAAFATDIGLFYMGNSLLQAGLQAVRTSPSDAYEDWKEKALEALSETAGGNPLAIFGVLPQHWNEPGKQGRVYAGTDANGRGIYGRLPRARLARNFSAGLLIRVNSLLNKLSPLVRPLMELAIGYNSLGQQMLPPNPQTIGDYIDTAGIIAKHLVSDLGPTQAIQGVSEMFKQHVLGQKTQADPMVSALKVLGPTTGLFLPSSGFPGGPAAGEMNAQNKSQAFRVQQAMPAIRDKIVQGNIDGARADMTALGMPPGLQRFYLNMTQNPGPGRTMQKRFQQTATPEQQRRVQFQQQP